MVLFCSGNVRRAHIRSKRDVIEVQLTFCVQFIAVSLYHISRSSWNYCLPAFRTIERMSKKGTVTYVASFIHASHPHRTNYASVRLLYIPSPRRVPTAGPLWSWGLPCGVPWPPSSLLSSDSVSGGWWCSSKACGMHHFSLYLGCSYLCVTIIVIVLRHFTTAFTLSTWQEIACV